MKWIVATVGIVVIVLLGFYIFSRTVENETQQPTPQRQTQSSQPENSQHISPTEQNNGEDIRIHTPAHNEAISSPLEITGEARGPWYFEANFPVTLVDGNGNELVRGIAQAQGDWMTEDFVSFTATLEFESSQTENGTLILENANPSGLPENAKEVRIPITFHK